MSWKNVKDELPKEANEIKVMILLTEEHKKLSSLTFGYEERVEKGWWKGQVGCFAFEDLENANHAVSHWDYLLPPPEKAHNSDYAKCQELLKECFDSIGTRNLITKPIYEKLLRHFA